MINSTDTPVIPQARVLMVDDKTSVCLALARSLTLLGYDADAATSGYQALEMLRRTTYDAMVLDIQMPGMNGIEVMQQARQTYPDLCIILLTGYASLESAIAAIRSHAEDYLCKPINVHDIAAAINQALQQRTTASLPAGSVSERFLRAGSLTLDLERHQVVAGFSEPVQLTASESKLLSRLIRHPNTVLSCRELAQDCLGYDVSEEEAKPIVQPHICRLRKKIEPDSGSPHLIQTVPKKGYYFANLSIFKV